MFATNPAPAPSAAPTGPRALITPAALPVIDLVNRELVSSSAPDSPAERPLESVWEATFDPEPPPAPLRRPWTPPTPASPARTEAPEGVPGSTNAKSLNRASGATQLMQISTTAGSAVPMACWVVSVRPLATPVASWTPIPRTSTMTTGVRAAAWNQRRLFQNHDRPASATRPAAEMAPVAARMIRAAARVSSTSRCPIAAIHRTMPSRPRTVATVASVTSAAEKSDQGSHSGQDSTPSSAFINARVRPPHAVTTITQ